jgi:hypothetical protein
LLDFEIVGPAVTILSQFDEKRQSRRSHVRIAASIRVEEDGPGFPCIVLDISNVGAKLEAGRPQLLPEQFSLVFSTSVQRRCQIMWRGEKFVGVKFVAD